MDTSGHGRFIVFEGGEGAGKTTQVGKLAESLRWLGCTVLETREPGGTPLGGHLRTLLLEASMPAKAEALLFLADRAVHVEQVIAPALARGEFVVCDRYADSSNVYQGVGRGLGVDKLAELSDWATGGLRPDLVIVLDIDPRAGLARARRHGGHDRIERETVEFHERVRAGFLAIAERHERHRRYLEKDGTPPTGPRYVVLDAAQPAAAVAGAVVHAVAALVDDPCPVGSGT